jgi:hypothetical protein
MPNKSDTKILQVLRGYAREDALVDKVVAERRLVLLEAKAAQPTPISI